MAPAALRLVTEKRCTQCGGTYPFTAEYFHADLRRPSGLRPYCKKCVNEDNGSRPYPPEYRRKLREKYREGAGRFRESVAYASKRARKFGVPDTLTEAEWHSKVKSLGFRCQICGGTCTLERKQPNSLSLEHGVPCSRGGGNTIENAVPACLACNRMKGELTTEEFKLWLAKVSTFLEVKC